MILITVWHCHLEIYNLKHKWEHTDLERLCYNGTWRMDYQEFLKMTHLNPMDSQS